MNRKKYVFSSDQVDDIIDLLHLSKSILNISFNFTSSREICKIVYSNKYFRSAHEQMFKVLSIELSKSS